MGRHWPILCGHWQPTQGTRETQGKAIQQPGHCTPFLLALVLAYEQKQTWQRSRIVVCRIARPNISHSPALQRSLTFPVDITEMGMGNSNATSSTRWSQGSNGAPPRWMPHRSPAMATAHSPLLSPARESEESAAAWWNGTAKEAHPEDEGGVQ